MFEKLKRLFGHKWQQPPQPCTPFFTVNLNEGTAELYCTGCGQFIFAQQAGGAKHTQTVASLGITANALELAAKAGHLDPERQAIYNKHFQA